LLGNQGEFPGVLRIFFNAASPSIFKIYLSPEKEKQRLERSMFR